MTVRTGGGRSPQRSDRASRRQLARVESGLLLRHPVLLLGAAGTVVLQTEVLSQVPDGGYAARWWSTQGYFQMGASWWATYGAAFVVGNLIALRDRESTTAETLRALPVTRHDRTLALLGSGIVPVLIAALVSLYVAARVSQMGGPSFGDVLSAERLRLTAWEVANPPAVTAAAFTAGVAVARLLPRPLLGVPLGVVGSMVLTGTAWVWLWFPVGFLVPFAVAAREGEPLGPDPSPETLAEHVPLLAEPDPWNRSWRVIELEPERVGWHGLSMLGVAIAWAGVAITRSGPPARRGWWVVAAGVLLAAAGFVLQVRSTGQTWSWFESTA